MLAKRNGKAEPEQVPSLVVATPEEARNGWSNEALQRFLESSLTPVELAMELVRRTGERERLCYRHLAEFNEQHPEERTALSTQTQKQLTALEIDLSRATASRLLAVAQLKEMS
jgi:hypothetical protein